MSNILRRILIGFRSIGSTLLAVLLVSISLLLINYYTIEILSGVRAYINGESYYSKGENNASRNLLTYLDTGEEIHWKHYNENIQINLGDGKALEMLTKGNITEAKKNLLLGKNHPDDIDVIIWLFTTFKEYSFMKEPISLWGEADVVVNKLYKLGFEVRNLVQGGQINPETRSVAKQKIYDLNTDLTLLGKHFLDSLSSTGRKISHLLLVANTIFILLIVGGAGLISMRNIKKIIRSEESVILKNKDLKQINSELDRFVYSASHDLRAPIISLKGLIKLTKMEKDSLQINQYLSMMELSLEKQDVFISKIISFSKNKRLEVSLEEIDLNVMIDRILDHHKFMSNYSSIEVRKNISSQLVHTDEVRLDIILSNIISNAIKYLDKEKDKPFIEIEAKVDEAYLKISIEDNGIGIIEADKNHIFDMFYMTKQNQNGSGVGLYIAKETVDKLGGNIKVASTINAGSKFDIIIPLKS
jgi:signal transduction histidine kinase